MPCSRADTAGMRTLPTLLAIGVIVVSGLGLAVSDYAVRNVATPTYCSRQAAVRVSGFDGDAAPTRVSGCAAGRHFAVTARIDGSRLVLTSRDPALAILGDRQRTSTGVTHADWSDSGARYRALEWVTPFADLDHSEPLGGAEGPAPLRLGGKPEVTRSSTTGPATLSVPLGDVPRDGGLAVLMVGPRALQQ